MGWKTVRMVVTRRERGDGFLVKQMRGDDGKGAKMDPGKYDMVGLDKETLNVLERAVQSEDELPSKGNGYPAKLEVESRKLKLREA